MDTTTIKETIDTNITTNGNGDITGEVLNTTLNDIVDAVEDGKIDKVTDVENEIPYFDADGNLGDSGISYSEVITEEKLYASLGFPTFTPANSYEAGDLVIYNYVLYKANTSHSGAWSDDDFNAVDLYQVIYDILNDTK